MKTKISLTRLADAQRYIDFVNSFDLKNIELFEETKDGPITIPIPSDSLDEWRFTGLNNKDFLLHFSGYKKLKEI